MWAFYGCFEAVNPWGKKLARGLRAEPTHLVIDREEAKLSALAGATPRAAQRTA
jgi:hypothetical protein